MRLIKIVGADGDLAFSFDYNGRWTTWPATAANLYDLSHLYDQKEITPPDSAIFDNEDHLAMAAARILGDFLDSVGTSAIPHSIEFKSIEHFEAPPSAEPHAVFFDRLMEVEYRVWTDTSARPALITVEAKRTNTMYRIEVVPNFR